MLTKMINDYLRKKRRNMKNDNDKWLESLREYLDGFEVEPRPGIWDSIERDAAAARRRPTLTVVGGGGCGGMPCTTVVGVYFLMRQIRPLGMSLHEFLCHHKNEDFSSAGFCRHSHTISTYRRLPRPHSSPPR